MAVCTNCGAQVPNTVKFCTECGRPMAAAPTPASYGETPTPVSYGETPAPASYGGTPAPEPYVGETPARSGGKGKKILLICLAALLLAGAVVGVLFLTGVLGGNKDYDRAMELYKSGQFEEAATVFDQLGDYKDSAEMANSCRYQQAKNAYSQENYDQALQLFQGLGSYKDSTDWVEKCQDKLFNPVGTYLLTGLKIDGEDYSDYISLVGYENYTIIFNADGTGSLAGGGSNVRFTWNGNMMDDGSDQIPYTYENDTIRFETEGVEMTFTRGTAPVSTPSPSTSTSPSTGNAAPGGTYWLSGLKIDGEDYSGYLAQLGYDKYSIVFNSDGTGTLNTDDGNVKFTWDASVIDDGTDRIPYTCIGNSVSFETEGVEMTFTREVNGPEGRYTGSYANGEVFSVVTFSSDGTFIEEFEGEQWYGTWVMEGNDITCTYDDGSHDYYVWNPSDDTLDWKGEGRVTYRK